MTNFKFNFESIVQRKARWLITLIAILTLGVGQMWGSYFVSEGMWQVWGKKTGYENDGWLATNINKGTDYNIGIITTDEYKIKGLSAKTQNEGDNVAHVYCYVTYPDGTSNTKELGLSTDGSLKYWEHKSLFDYSVPKTTPGNFQFKLDFYINNGSADYGTTTQYIKWTIPGFSTTSISKSFGTTIPINTVSETTISFGQHYGTALTTEDCEIDGTDASDFTVWSISETGVQVAFHPTEAGVKSAILTITDAHSKTCTISLSGTAHANGTMTTLYLNDYNYNSNWADGGALFRFTCAYTDGIYTLYPMTQCDNSTYNWCADVEIQENVPVNIDRYDPSFPYATWNTLNVSGVNASNPYAVIDNLDNEGRFHGFATNHPYNEVSGGNIYYDNTVSGLANTLYFIVGHDYRMSNGGDEYLYSKSYSMERISNTNLYYQSFTDTWHDADYYAVVGASSDPGIGYWGTSSLPTKGSAGGYTGIHRSVLDLASGSTYLASAPSNTGSGSLTIIKSPTLTTTQTFNYALYDYEGDTYTVMTSGDPNTPGKLSMASYEFTNAGCTAVVDKSAQELAANATTYTKEVSNVAYTGTTILTESNTRDGYSFMGWYKGNSTQRTNSSTHNFAYYPQGDSIYTARYKAHRYTITFNNNDDQYSTAPAATGSMDPISNVVYDQTVTLTKNNFKRTGYHFTGWNRNPDGTGDSYTDEREVSNLSASDGATVILYAQWEANTYEITLNNRGATRAVDPTSVTATYNSTTLTAITTLPAKWGCTFDGWVANSNGTGDAIIDASGNLVEDIDGYTDGDGMWTRDEGDLTLYAKWTPKEHLYLISGSGSEVSGGTEFTRVGESSIYYATVDMEKNDKFHLGDGENKAGPEEDSDYTFSSPLGMDFLAFNGYCFKYTGTNKQTIVVTLDLDFWPGTYDKVRVSVDHLVIYKPGDKAGDTQTDYGSVEGFSGTIYGEFEFRMSVSEDEWSTLYLPFSPTAVKVYEDLEYYNVVPYERPGGKGNLLYNGDYIIRKPSNKNPVPVKDFGDWEDPESYYGYLPSANIPYIIMWHDWTDHSYFDGKYVSFFGNGVTIPASMEAEDAPEEDNYLNIYGNPSLSTVSVDGAYTLVKEDEVDIWKRPDEPETSSSVPPFGCYIMATEETVISNSVLRRRLDDTTTGWDDVLNSEYKSQILVYTINGYQIAQFQNCSFNEVARKLSEVQSQGIYILRAGDENVKLIIERK